MSLTIRQRCSAVAKCLQKFKGVKTIRAISEATGLSKSSVSRHKQAIERRDRYPESSWWETEAGGAWLKLLVLGVVYYFGIKQGIGAESLSEFFRALGLSRHVACSVSSKRRLKGKILKTIVAYGTVQAEHCQPSQGQGIGVGGDETFFDLPILVMVELSSGYILTEVESDNRTYNSWVEQIQSWWMQGGWHCHFMVSDGAKALIKLALEGLDCVRVADLFHALRDLGQPLGSASGRALSQLKKQQSKLSEQLAKTTELAKRSQLYSELEQLAVKRLDYESAQSNYQQSLHAITQGIHPFNLTTGDWQLWEALQLSLCSPLEQLRSLALDYGTSKAISAIDNFQQQIPSFAQGIHAWWRWVCQALQAETDDLALQQWVLESLLPWAYWHQQTDKTKNCELKVAYQAAQELAFNRLISHPLTQQLETEVCQGGVGTLDMHQISTDLFGSGRAQWLFISSLSYLSRFRCSNLKSAYRVRNFDIRRADGTTAAQRLFGQSFPNLFEWVVDHMGELPRPRQSSSIQQSNPLSRLTVPA